MNRRRPPVPLGECKLCHDPVVWIQLDTGSAMPLNPLPVESDDKRGNVLARVIGRRLHGWVESTAHPFEPYMLRMIPHVSTCEVARRARADTGPEDPSLF